MEQEQFLDINRKKSIKRIWANRLLWTALAMVWVYFTVFIASIVLERGPIEKFPFELWLILFGSGLTPLGMTLWEQKQ